MNRKPALAAGSKPQAAQGRSKTSRRGTSDEGDSHRSSMSEEAYRIIKLGILRNKYPGGFQIIEDELARSLSMSRTPVREALLRLESEGLIDLIPRRGMRVALPARTRPQEVS